MAWFISGRTQFNLDHLKGVDLNELIDRYKGKESAENVKAAWEEVNGKAPKRKKRTPKKESKEE